MHRHHTRSINLELDKKMIHLRRKIEFSILRPVCSSRETSGENRTLSSPSLSIRLFSPISTIALAPHCTDCKRTCITTFPSPSQSPNILLLLLLLWLHRWDYGRVASLSLSVPRMEHGNQIPAQPQWQIVPTTSISTTRTRSTTRCMKCNRRGVWTKKW